MGRSGVGFKSWSRVHYKALRDLDVSRCVKMDLGATYSYERMLQLSSLALFNESDLSSQIALDRFFLVGGVFGHQECSSSDADDENQLKFYTEHRIGRRRSKGSFTLHLLHPSSSSIIIDLTQGQIINKKYSIIRVLHL
ncbi:astrotactin-2-like isoform X1 [Tachysurus ichikawai]